MFNLLAANLHDGNAHDLTSSLGLIGNSLLMSAQQGVTSSSRGREFSSSPGEKISRMGKIFFIPTADGPIVRPPVKPLVFLIRVL